MRKPVQALASLALLAAAASCDSAADGDEKAPANMIERGKHLVAIMDCAGCHNIGSFSPQPDRGFLEGGTIGFEVPGLGIFYPPNLTPHREAGLGAWSEGQIVAALRTGVRPDGRVLAPAMPWRAYANLGDEDARAVAAYLKSLPPSARKVPGPASAETAPAPYLTVKLPSGS